MSEASADVSDTRTGDGDSPKRTSSRPPKGLNFWLIILSVCITLWLYALELTAVSTALPTIANALHADQFVWVGSAYALASTAFLPLSGGLAEVFGRKPAALLSLLLFSAGSAIGGAAKNMSMLIAGRTVQGLGGGGILGIGYIILADLTSLEERGVYSGIFGLAFATACFVGPVIGGTLASQGSWRWLFYLNIPIAGFAALVVQVFMHLPTPPGTFQEKLGKLDWIGNILIMGSTTACTIALTWGGIQAPWDSAKVLVPLVLGLFGFLVFLVYEAKVAAYPLIPFSVMTNRTSISGYLQTFFVGLVTLGTVYFLPVYYQACHGASAIRSGVLILGLASLSPASIMAGISIKKSGKYRPQMWFGWCLIVVGLGLLSTLKVDTSVAKSVGFSLLLGFGIGCEFATTIFPVQAPLSVTLNAPSMAFLLFIRTFASIWGITIGSTILENQLKSILPESIISQLPHGISVTYALIPQISSLSPPVALLVREAFAKSLRLFWHVFIGIAGLGLISSLFMKGVPLSSFTDEKWDIPQNKEPQVADAVPVIVDEKVLGKENS